MGSVHRIIVLMSVFAATHGAPLQLHEPSSSYTTDAVLPSLCVLVVMLVILLNCTNVGRCCLKLFRKDQSQDANASMVFNNPIADDSQHVSPIDISGMELNPITFEPLPGVQHLTPESSNLFNELPRFNTDRPLRARNPKSNENVIYSPGFPGLSHSNVNTTPDLSSCDWFDEPFRNFPRDNVEFVSDVGPGWFGNVVEAIAEDIVPYSKALKVNVKVLRDNADTSDKLKFLKEAQFFRDANHENVLKVLGHCIEKDPFLVIFEYFPVDLKSYLISCVSKPDSLTSSSFHIQAALDIAQGLEYMTQLDFIHPDLAARNCLVSSEGRVVIGDYGLAVRTHRDDYYWNNGLAIPLRWAAPETLKCTMNTIQTLQMEKASNIWTLAVTAWELCEFGKLPYADMSDKQVISLLISEQLSLKPPLRAGLLMKTEMFDLMQQCLNFKPEYRPQISTIVFALKDLMKLSFTKPSVRNISPSPVRTANDDFEKKWEEASPKSNTELVSPKDNLQPTKNALQKKSVSFSDKKGNFPESINNNRSVLSSLNASIASKHGDENVRSTNRTANFVIGRLSDHGDSESSSNFQSEHSTTSRQSLGSRSANSSNITSGNLLETNEQRPSTSGSSTLFTLDTGGSSSHLKASATQLEQYSVVDVDSSTSDSKNVSNKLAVKRSARTSTPTGSPYFNANSYNAGNASGSSNVFEEEFTMNLSESVSPITSDMDSSNIVMGPSEDLGLEPFQKVSSELSIGLQGTGEETGSLWETFEETAPTVISEQNGKSGFLDIFAGSENGPTPRQATPFSISLPPERENEPNGAKVAKKLLFNTIDIGTSDNSIMASRTAFQIPTRQENAHPSDFERDIIQATDESSSLVLQDLEDEVDDVTLTLVKETVVPENVHRVSSIMFEITTDNSSVHEDNMKDTAVEFSSPVEKFAIDGAEERNSGETNFSGFQQSTSTSYDSQVRIDQYSSNSDNEPLEDTSELCKNFVPSTWDQKLEPKKPALKSPEVSQEACGSTSLLETSQSSVKSNMKKSVSFERKRPPVVYQYPPPIISDSEDDDRNNIPSTASNLLDWELQPDELVPEDNTDDVELDFAVPRQRRQVMDVYSISGFGSSPVGSDSGHGFEAVSVSHSSQDSVSVMSSENNALGALRHTKGNLKLDLPSSFN